MCRTKLRWVKMSKASRQQKYHQTIKGKEVHRRSNVVYRKSKKGIKAARARRQTDVFKQAHIISNRKSRLWSTYGITIEDYDNMLKAQGGVCIMCKRPPKSKRLAIDHDHKTGRVRGLLCFICNRYLVGKNTIETARKVCEYLERKVALGLEK